MPRPLRKVKAGGYYHVLNRGNGRMRIFHKEADVAAFLKVLSEGMERYPVGLLAYCLMGNHWHLVLRPGTAAALGDLMRWVGVTHYIIVTRHGGNLNQPILVSVGVNGDGVYGTDYSLSDPIAAVFSGNGLAMALGSPTGANAYVLFNPGETSAIIAINPLNPGARSENSKGTSL